MTDIHTLPTDLINQLVEATAENTRLEVILEVLKCIERMPYIGGEQHRLKLSLLQDIERLKVKPSTINSKQEK